MNDVKQVIYTQHNDFSCIEIHLIIIIIINTKYCYVYMVGLPLTHGILYILSFGNYAC